MSWRSLISGYVSDWFFDEVSGTTAADDLGVEDGEYINSPTLTSGLIAAGNGTGVNLNGSSQYVLVPSNAAHSPGTGDFSVGLWAQPAAVKTQDLFAKKAAGSASGYALRLFSTGTLGYEFYDGSTLLFSNSAVSSAYTDGERYFFVMVVDRTNTVMRLYINGSLRKTVDLTGFTGSLDSDIDLHIGARLGSGAGVDNHFSGLLDEMFYEDSALTTAEVGTLYAEGLISGSARIIGSGIIGQNI